MKKQKVGTLFLSSVQAGFPSPAEDVIDKNLDLNEYLIKSPAATFLVRVSGNSMIGAGIFSGDLLVVDRSLEYKTGSIAVVIIDGEFTVKTIKKRGNNLYLVPENPKFKEIKVTENNDFEIWGIVSAVIRELV